MSFSGSPSVQTLLSEIICHGSDVWRDHMHCHSIVCCWGWGTLSTATAANESWLLEVFNRVISFPRTCTFFPPENWICERMAISRPNDFSRPSAGHCMYVMSFFGILWVVLILFTQMVTQPRSQSPFLHGGRVGEDPGNEVDGYHLTY